MTAPALVVMTRPPVPGRCKTRLIPALGAEGAALLHEAMLRDVVGALTRIPAREHALLVTPEDDGVARIAALFPVGWRVEPQEQGDLGARLRAGLQRFGAAGPVVFLGSDAPTLRYEALAAVVARMGAGSAFFAPCSDGGYSAIGLSSRDAGLFEGIPWSTERVAEVTRQRAIAAGISLEAVPLGDDVDSPGDLERLRRELTADPSRAPITAALLRSLKTRA